MLIPALVLLGLRVGLGDRLDPFLHRVSYKLGKFAGETLLWVVGIVGFLLLRRACHIWPRWRPGTRSSRNRAGSSGLDR